MRDKLSVLGQKSQGSRICIIGDRPEAAILAALFAETGQANYLVRPSSKTASISEEDHDARTKSLFSIHQDTDAIRISPSLEDIPITEVSILILTSHASAEEQSRHEMIVRKVAPELVQDASFLYTGLCRPNYTGTVIGKNLEKHSGLVIGKDFGLYYMPLFWSGESVERFRERPRILAARPTLTQGQVPEIILRVFPSVRSTRNIETAEAAGLYAAASQEVVQALQFELAMASERDGIDFRQVLELCKGSGSGFLASHAGFQTSQAIASSIMFQNNMKNLRRGLVQTARKVNEEFQAEVFRLVKRAVQRTGQPIRRSRIAILGSEWMSSRHGFELPLVVKQLSRKCASVTLYSCNDTAWSLPDKANDNVKVETSALRALSKANCALVALPGSLTRELDARQMALEMSRPATICDLTGVMIASNVEQAGIFYTTLGRGTWNS